MHKHMHIFFACYRARLATFLSTAEFLLAKGAENWGCIYQIMVLILYHKSFKRIFDYQKISKVLETHKKRNIFKMTRMNHSKQESIYSLF